MKSKGLRDTAMQLLTNRPVSLKIKAIAKDLNISESWLRTFASGNIENPGVVTIEALIAYLQNYQAKVVCQCSKIYR